MNVGRQGEKEMFRNSTGFTGTTSINCGTLAYSGNYNDSNVKFYSGAVGSDSFIATGFDMGLQQTSWDPSLSGRYILPVPKPETWATGILLLLGGAWWMIKRTRKAA